MGEHRVSNSQLEELLDYLATHPNLAKGVGLGARSKEAIEKEWANIAKKLNSHGSGASKSGQRWKRYWIDLKHKVKTRAASRRREAEGTGGGPAVEQCLSEIDNKILSIIGEGAVYGDTQYRIPVFQDRQIGSTSRATNIERIDPVPFDVTETNSEDESMLDILPSTGNDNQDERQQLQPEVIQIYTVDESSSELRPILDGSQENINQDAGTKKRGMHQTTPGKCQSTPRKFKKIEPDWVIELERKRVEAEEKHSSAALLMAEASRTQAEAALILANAAKVQAEAAMLQAEAMKNQSECLLKILGELRK